MCHLQVVIFVLIMASLYLKMFYTIMLIVTTEKGQKVNETFDDEDASTRELREKIFPTLYAIFQQKRGTRKEYKIRNRSLRSLCHSCLYHKQVDQLQRTLTDSEKLLEKYCSGIKA